MKAAPSRSVYHLNSCFTNLLDSWVKLERGKPWVAGYVRKQHVRDWVRLQINDYQNRGKGNRAERRITQIILNK